MDIFRIIGVALITVVAILVVKQVKPEIAVILGIAGGIVILIMAIDSFSAVFNSFKSLINRAGLSTNMFNIIFKIIGIGYLTEFAVGVCEDSGSSGLASKVLLAGKVTILAMAMPILSNILTIVSDLLP